MGLKPKETQLLRHGLGGPKRDGLWPNPVLHNLIFAPLR